MPDWLAKTRRRARARAVLISVAVALLPLFLACPIALSEAQRDLQGDVSEAAHSAISQIGHILEAARVVAAQAAPFVGTPCPQVETELRRLTVAAALVRSTNLVQNGDIYCASVDGAVSAPEEPERYADGRLRLMARNLATPRSPVLIYRLRTAAGSVLVGIAGEHLRDVLQLVGRGHMGARAAIGDLEIDQAGSVSTKSTNPPAGRTIARAQSGVFPIIVETTADDNEVWRYFSDKYASILVLMGLLSAIAGVASYRGMLRGFAPSRELLRALEADEILPYYQPIFYAGTGEIYGVEVLMRWKSPVDGLIPADHFIPFAEENGLIVPMTNYIAQRCQRELIAVQGLMPHNFRVSINISAKHLKTSEIINLCQDLISSVFTTKIIVVLEMVEREQLIVDQEMQQHIEKLRELGVEFALDDFGTGYSGLSYVQSMRFDTLKVDKIFVRGCDEPNSVPLQILTNIVDLSHRFKMRTVAEGVETAAQRDVLVRLGIDCLQGYLLGRPGPLEELSALLESGRR